MNNTLEMFIEPTSTLSLPSRYNPPPSPCNAQHVSKLPSDIVKAYLEKVGLMIERHPPFDPCAKTFVKPKSSMEINTVSEILIGDPRNV